MDAWCPCVYLRVCIIPTPSLPSPPLPSPQASGPRGRVLSFYTMPEYEAWKESLGGSTKGWSVKYYKVSGE